MEITQAEWTRFKNMLSAINTRAVDDMMDWLESKGGIANVSFQEMSSYGYALATKYGEASASLSAQMYDEVAAASGMTLPAAEVADTVSYTEIAKAITKVAAQTQSAQRVSDVVGRYTKRAGADTTLKNAERDGAQFAWVPAGDSCAFCITLASRGWQFISKKSFKNGHAEHIHTNCDCTYAVRFDKKTNVAGYDPQVYKDMYYGAEGNTPQEKINSMRRMQYKARRIEQEKKSRINDYSVNKNIVGTKEYRDKFSQITSNDAVNSKLYDKAMDILDHRNGTDYEDMHLISITDGLVKGSQTKVEYFEGIPEELKHNHVWYNESLDHAINANSSGTLISIHNHPRSLPPSGGDFEGQFNNGYKGGVIACHNGDIYYYEVGKKKFSGTLFDMTVDKYANRGYSELEAYEKALEQFEKEYGITWRKL